MATAYDFDEIRPFRDDEVPGVLKRLADDADFMNLIQFSFPSIDEKIIRDHLLQLNTNLEFQGKVVYPAVKSMLQSTSTGFTTSGFERLNPNQAYLFISNHRDITLDPALLNYALYENQHDTTEIAIGDNLLLAPWIEDLVKLNKSFIVHRSVQGRESLKVSQRLSAYIRHSITARNSSIWIAQREGRTKNGHDQTQVSLLKMLNMSGESSIIQDFRSLRIVPISISYEWDPCAALKVWETRPEAQLVSPEEDARDDIKNMVTGYQGKKGSIHFAAGTPIDTELELLAALPNKNEQLKALANLIDEQIYQRYKLYPNNYLALDLQLDTNRFTNEYNEAEQQIFEDHLQQQMGLIPPLNGLEDALLEMYAKPLKNHFKAKEKGN